MTSESAKPYTFPNWLMMRPGDLIMGLSIVDRVASLADRWYVSDPKSLKNHVVAGEGYPLLVMFERDYRWRVNLKDRREIIGANHIFLYKVTLKDLKESFEKNPAHKKIFRFKFDLPIGIFMGHVIHVDNTTFVNILSSEGFDIWVGDDINYHRR